MSLIREIYAKIRNISWDIINPSTEEKQDDIIWYIDWIETIIDNSNTKLDDIYTRQWDWNQTTKLTDKNWVAQWLLMEDWSITIRDYTQAIAEWDILNHYPFFKIWYWPSSTASQTTLWNLWTEYVFPTANISVEAVSSNINDTSAWSWAKTIHLQYLNSDYEEKDFIFTMNWTTPVAWPIDFFRVNSFHVMSWTKSAWIISLRLVWWAATIYSQMPIWATRSRNSVYTVPIWKNVYIDSVFLSCAYSTSWKSERITLHCSIDPHWSVITTWLLFYPIFEAMIMDWCAIKPKNWTIRFPEKTDVKVSIIWETNAQSTSAISWWIETA